MINKNEGTINLKEIRFEVEDLQLSIAFYRKLGCMIEEVENSKHLISAYIIFNYTSTIKIHLFKDFTRTEKLTEEEKAPVFIITAIEDENRDFAEVLDEIHQNGITYTNVDPKTIIPIVAKFNDESGHNWELMDDFNYPGEEKDY